MVVFAHGWPAMDPNYYGSWLTHIVRRGFTVIAPRYQADVRTPVSAFTGNALDATALALREFSRPGRVAVDPRGVVLGGTPEQRNMGRWSDGVPVRQLIVGKP